MSLSLAEVSELELESLIDSGLDPAVAFEQVFPRGSPVPKPWDWWWWGRPEQIWRPGPEIYTLALAGRGWGKNQMGSHACDLVGNHPELCGGRPAEGPDDKRAGAGAIMGIAGRTANDVNQTIIDGDSGIMASCDPALRPEWNKSDKTLTWKTGVKARLMSGDVPASFRGPNFGFLYADELAHWARAVESWKQCGRAFRKSSRGQHRRALITTTPLGTSLVQSLAWVMREGAPVRAPAGTPDDRQLQGYLIRPDTRIITGSTYDNASNLDASYLTETAGQFEGTADAGQEVWGLIRLKTPGALWDQDWFQRCEVEQVPELDKVIVAVDPTSSDGMTIKGTDKVCECGIVAMGMVTKARKVWALQDRSLVAKPGRWANEMINLAMEVGATEIVVEGNIGWGLVLNVFETAWSSRRSEFRNRRKPKIVHARATVTNKAERAALAAPGWEAGKVVHAGPARRWVSCERQMTTYDPNKPHKAQQSDRMDAIVWGALSLLGDGTDRSRVEPYTDAEAWQRILAAGAGR